MNDGYGGGFFPLDIPGSGGTAPDVLANEYQPASDTRFSDTTITGSREGISDLSE